MVRPTVIFLFVSGLLASAGGCGVIHALVCEPFGPNRLCDTTHCQDGSCGTCAACTAPAEDGRCGPAEETRGAGRGPAVRGRWCARHRVYGCRVCADACDSCEDSSCGPRDCWRPGPLTWLFRWFGCGTFCGSGCGPRYWGDWYGDPPDCCDPCDNYGSFTAGPQSCSSCSRAPGYAAASARPATCPSCGRTLAKTPTTYAQPAAAAYSRTSAPRVISQTDRAVTPVGDDETPHLAQPRKATPR